MLVKLRHWIKEFLYSLFAYQIKKVPVGSVINFDVFT